MKQQISPVAAVVAVVVFLGIAAFAYMKTGSPSAPDSAEALAAKGPGNFFAQKAKECSGDFSRLSAQDQQQIQAMTGGKGAETMRQMYQQK